MTRWTASMVEARLEEAASTLRRLPEVKVRGYFGVWPEIVHDADDRHDWEAGTSRLGPPSAQAISRMEETLTWSRGLTQLESRLIWMRANNVRWKTICAATGYGRTMAWEHWVYALTKIADRLSNGQRESQSQLPLDFCCRTF